MEFVHLHNHSEYSLLDGACRILDNKGNPAEFIKLAAKYGMNSLAITDHGNLFGVIEFYQGCLKEGIKPIIGCEVYIDPEEEDSRKSFHLTLLAKDNTGYKNLMKLVSKGFVENLVAGKGKIKKEWLREYSEGLIALSGCLQGEVASLALQESGEKKILDVAGWYREVFGKENFFVEIMNNGMKEQQKVIPQLVNMAKKIGVGIVATNDVHYVNKDGSLLQEVLLCIGTGTTLTDPKRLKFSTQEFYFKTPQQMKEIFKDYPEAIKNTVEIAKRCNVEINFDKIYLPEFKLPEGETAESFLKKLCEEGLKKRYKEITPEVKQRLEYELSVINKMGFAAYFLIVWDFINYARSKNIPVGPGRGSGAGALVSYCLGITNIDPIKYGLLFERFLNPDRKTMPDLDIDFADWGREEVINYVTQKYGQENVARIITFNTIKARNAIRDVARVLGLPISLADKVAKVVPPNSEIPDALREIKELQTMYSSNKDIKQLLDYARQIEGFKRHTGVHAAGVIIASSNITDFVPLYRRSKDEPLTTQYYDEEVLKLGLLKVDFLGLKTLSVIEETLKLIEKNHNKKIDLTKIDFNDEKTFKLLQDGNTVGVFQLESAGMRDLLRKLKPTVFEDIIACNALFRPGPIGSGMVTEFVERKHKRKEIKYDHPLLENILKDTYGIIVYQEQAMIISRVLSGFTPGESDSLRKAIAKKYPEELTKMGEKFISGAKKNGVDTRIAKKIFEQIEHFGEYGFNKSHATAYALVSYQCAYLKANYTIEYLIAMLNSELKSGANVKSSPAEEEKKFIKYLKEVENMGFKLLPPDVNRSEVYFTKESSREIRFGLVAVKNVGFAAAEIIVDIRNKTGIYKNFEDFISRTESHSVNKKVIESLIMSGAMDSLVKDRMSIEEKCIYRKKFTSEINNTNGNKKNNFSQQEFLFSSEKIEDKVEEIDKFTEQEVFEQEHLLTGIYWSGHPLEKHLEEINAVAKIHIESIPQEDGLELELVGMITTIKKSVAKSGKPWAKFYLEDLTGEVEVLVFPESYERNHTRLHKGAIVYLKGRLSIKEEQKSVIAEEIESFLKVKEKLYQRRKKLFITLSSVGVDEEYIESIKEILTRYPGEVQVYLNLITKNYEKVLVETDYKVIPSNKMLSELKHLLGDNPYHFE